MEFHILTMTRGDEHRLRDWLAYHESIGFTYFHMLVDNEIDNTVAVLQEYQRTSEAEIDIWQLPPDGEYFEYSNESERFAAVKRWREANAEYIKQSGLKIVDPLSDRQYKVFPQKLKELQEKFPEDWVALIDVDEYIALPGTNSVQELVASHTEPRLRLLNFNFDMSNWDGKDDVRKNIMRWSREGIVAYGKGWDERVKAIVKISEALPLISVHAISAGHFEIADYHIARLHHYKYPNQVSEIPYDVEDRLLLKK